jgi:phosphoglycolate phosphatase
MTQPNTVLFDLDGTLVDTAPDLGLALNLQRERHDLAQLPLETIRPYASHGSRGLLGIGFGMTPEHPDFGTMREEYLDLYDQVFTRSPILFDGVAELLDSLEEAGLLWGVVTNKPSRFTRPLMDSLGMTHRASCIVSGDDAPRQKPHPDTLLLACKLAGTVPASCVYIGDAERDIQAGKAAGMRTIVALYGYIDAHDRPDAWGAESQIAAPRELLQQLGLSAPVVI